MPDLCVYFLRHLRFFAAKIPESECPSYGPRMNAARRHLRGLRHSAPTSRQRDATRYAVFFSKMTVSSKLHRKLFRFLCLCDTMPQNDVALRAGQGVRNSEF